jgi:pyridoxine 4-dehydrogenase
MTQTFSIGGDLSVSRLGFGAMRICGPGIWNWPHDRESIAPLLKRVVELDIQLIDTADSYGPETSEYLLAEHLSPYSGLVIATKGGLERGGPGSWTTNGRPAHLRIACENSLRRLEIERIDLYQLHAVDDDVALEDSLGVLAEMQSEGKIRHLGVSNFSVEQLKRAQKVAKIATVQNRYNLAYRNHDDVLEYCQESDIGFIPWYPLAAGELLQRSEFKTIAEKYDATASQLCLAWLLKRSPVMLPIPGTSSIAHLEENTRARSIELSDADFSSLSDLLS